MNKKKSSKKKKHHAREIRAERDIKPQESKNVPDKIKQKRNDGRRVARLCVGQFAPAPVFGVLFSIVVHFLMGSDDSNIFGFAFFKNRPRIN